MNLQSNDFELFGVPERFAQNMATLDSRWKELQRQAHPDQFAAHGAAAQRLAMQWSVRINEAYGRLKDPLKRAAYLCELQGVPIHAHTNTAMPSAFLMQQMEWREALDDATTLAQLDEIALKSDQHVAQQLSEVERLIDSDGDFTGAAEQVRALMFSERFATDIEGRMDRLGQ